VEHWYKQGSRALACNGAVALLLLII